MADARHRLHARTPDRKGVPGASSTTPIGADHGRARHQARRERAQGPSWAKSRDVILGLRPRRKGTDGLQRRPRLGECAPARPVSVLGRDRGTAFCLVGPGRPSRWPPHRGAGRQGAGG